MRPFLSKTRPSGSALLVALIVMGILLTLSLGVSDILIGTMRSSRQLLEKTKAWYAAESGIEHAMAEAAENPPGFETEAARELEGADAKYEYRIKSTAKQIPAKEPYEILNEEDSYAALRLNESVTIPLFTGQDEENTVRNFRVDYYLAPDLELQGGMLSSGVDILRWKIFGIAADGTMEVINEFLPVNEGDSAHSPTCLGTGNNCWNVAKFYERRLAPDGATEFHIVENYPISTFLTNHRQNFLVLTNTVNTDLIAGALSQREKQKLAIIRYRVIEGDGRPRLTLPHIKLAADGYSGNAKQSLNLEIKRESFLPVFNYALYRTAK